MKNPTLRVAFAILLAIQIFSFGCQRPGGGAETTPSPSPYASPEMPSPEESPSLDNTKQSGEFVQAVANGFIDYELSGLGDSGAMSLKVKNKTERVWEVSIEVGTKLEPESGNVQRMVVTKEIEVEVEAHDEETLELEVSCLDITKPPPAAVDRRWRIVKSKDLAGFIGCASQAISVLERSGQVKAEERSGLIQYSLWQARGATRDEWLSFLQEHGKLTEQQAEQAYDSNSQFLNEIIRNCPSLLNI